MRRFWFGALTLSSLALAQSATLTLPQAIHLALAQSTQVLNAQASLQSATAQLAALKADPNTLIVPLTQAEQAVTLAQVNLQVTRLQVLQSTLSAYLALYEDLRSMALAQAQVALAQRNLAIQESKFANGNATSLDVAQARTALAAQQQTLANDQAQEPSLLSQLVTDLGTNLSATPKLAPPPPPQALTASLSELQQGLSERLPALVQDEQAVALDTLQVKLDDNDYTPPLTLTTAKIALGNAQRTLSLALANAVAQLQSAYQAAQNSFALIAIARQNLANAQTTLKQDQAAFKAGTVSAVQIQSDEVSLKSQKLSLQEAQDGYWRALAALSIAAGEDLTGLEGQP